jgi:CHASE2 domain-containing sensor protein
MFRKIANKHVVGCTLFIFSIQALASFVPIRGPIVDPLHDALYDMELTDLVFSKLRKETEADTNIVIVNIGELSREMIAKELQIIAKYEPRVIGIDVLFKNTKDRVGDSLLKNELQAVKRLIMASKLDDYNKEEKKFKISQRSHTFFMENATPAYTNFITRSKDALDISTCRTFSPMSLVNNKKEYAFSVALAKEYDKEKTELFLKRNKETEIINFKGNMGGKFFALDVDDVLKENFSPDIIKDKIVLFGFLGPAFNKASWEDKFFTPLNNRYIGRSNPDMYGVVIHANIISMILHNDYINQVPMSISYTVAVLLCLLNVALFSWINKKTGNLYDLISKGIQLIETFLLLFVIVLLFYYFNIKFNLTVTIVTVLLTGDLLEIYYSVVKIPFANHVKRIFKKIN